MTEQILRAKHWQVFMLAYGFHLISTILFLSFPIELFLEVAVYTFILLGSITILWYYSVGVSLQKIIPEELRRPTGFFKVSLFVFTILTGMIFMVPVSGMLMVLLATTLGGQVIITSLILFITFCLVYAAYYTAKTLKTAELQRPSTFSDFSTDVFLIYFLPFGIWFIQPRINELVQPTSTDPGREEFV